MVVIIEVIKHVALARCSCLP